MPDRRLGQNRARVDLFRTEWGNDGADGDQDDRYDHHHEARQKGSVMSDAIPKVAQLPTHRTVVRPTRGELGRHPCGQGRIRGSIAKYRRSTTRYTSREKAAATRTNP